MPREISAGAVVFRREEGKIKYLLLHYDAGHWDFPKGKTEHGESPEKTARREIKEETNIHNITFIEGFEEKINYFFRRANETVYKEAAFFLAETKTADVRVSFEHLGYVWLEYDHALRTITFQNSKDVLTKAHKFLQKSKEKK